ncbi:anti-sigma factor [Pedobacter sp. HMWF019]|uniref:FecR family protein n=1 Tax=Pedobacter sp. HMWF019 TaxID=2056856 RepID=UPI000D370E04|nr:FecR domain-containing protein [Pedobacter sp. HMWF019]PTS96010.1 anti-sigma factor [Pedobacter sp. HMWF019]
MEPSRINVLIQKYKEGVASHSEREELMGWYQEIAYRDAEFPGDEQQTGERVWSRLKQSMGYSVKKSNYKKWFTAAAAVLFIVAGSLYYMGRDGKSNQQDIVPGINKAYLIMGNGKRISLNDVSNGSIATEAGVEISKTADGQIVYKIHAENAVNSNLLNRIETPRGGQYQVELPDGTKVWLNAASVLQYPVRFALKGDRSVELEGEAYFEVAKDATHPFKVKSTGQLVEVLGTHFNISSYAEEGKTITTLLEGSIELNQHVILKPNEQTTLLNGQISLISVDAMEAIAWKQGLFVFDGDTLEEVMKKISRWYNVETVFEDTALKSKKFSGRVSRSLNLSKVLEKLEIVGGVKFDVSKSTIIVKNNNR